MKTHAIYGDDDIIRIEKIFKEKDNIQQMVDASNRQLMKERLKTTTKKKSIDTTANATVVKETPPEIDAKPRFPKKPEEEIKKEEIQKQVKKEKKAKKKQNQNVAKKILTLIIVLILLAIVLAFKDDIYQGVKGFLPDNVAGTVSTDNGENKVDTKLKNALYSATDSNEQLKKHYKNFSDLVNNSDTEISKSSLETLREEIKTDKETFMKHSSEFSSYSGGESYYNSILSRFINLENAIDQIGTIENVRDARNLASQAITYENELVETDKEVLKNFLDKNGIAYTEKTESISFDI